MVRRAATRPADHQVSPTKKAIYVRAAGFFAAWSKMVFKTLFGTGSNGTAPSNRRRGPWTANGWPSRSRTSPPAALRRSQWSWRSLASMWTILPAAPVQVAQQIALIFVGRGDFHLHDRFEQDRMRLLGRFFEGEDAGHLEGQLAGIHFVECAVHDRHLHIHHRVARQHAALDGLFDAVNDRRDVFLGNRAADDLVLDLDAFAALVGLQRDAGVAVLAAAAGLADELAFAFGGFGDGLAIGDLRRAGVGARP